MGQGKWFQGDKVWFPQFTVDSVYVLRAACKTLGRCFSKVKSLQESAGECKSAASIIHALKCLEEHREFLPKTLMPVLGPYGCQDLEGDGLSVAEEAAKAAVLASLAKLSVKMVEGILQSGSSAASDQLMQLCRSTELNEMLGIDLEDEYFVKPMCAKLAPGQGWVWVKNPGKLKALEPCSIFWAVWGSVERTQGQNRVLWGDIDGLVKTMETSLTDDWHSKLLSINERITAAGEHGSRVLSSVDLKLDDFCSAASKRISRSKNVVTDAVKRLVAPKVQMEVYEGSWAALSLNETPEEFQDTDSDRGCGRRGWSCHQRARTVAPSGHASQSDEAKSDGPDGDGDCGVAVHCLDFEQELVRCFEENQAKGTGKSFHSDSFLGFRGHPRHATGEIFGVFDRDPCKDFAEFAGPTNL